MESRIFHAKSCNSMQFLAAALKLKFRAKFHDDDHHGILEELISARSVIATL